jgi:hypothetical protein
VLDRVSTHGDQLARIRQGGVHCHPGAGLVRRSGELCDGADWIGRRRIGPYSQIREVSDDLDPSRAPVNLRQRAADKLRLAH